MASVQVSLPDPVKEWIEDRVRHGPYDSVSDYLLALIKDDQKKRNSLVDALIEGEASGIGTRSIREIVKDSEAKLANGEV